MGCDKHPPHADTTSSLCPMGLRGQTEQTPTSRSGIGSDTICNDPAQPCRYCPLRAQGALTALKRVYKVERSPYLYSARKFLPYPMWDVTDTPPPPPPHADTTSWLCPMGLRGQTEQTPTSRSGIGSDTICNDPAQPCRYCPLRAQGALTALKRVYKVERSPYLYSARKFLPYPMWDVTEWFRRVV